LDIEVNIKYYIRGLGMGILLTTVLLTVSNHMRNGSNATLASQNPTTQQETSRYGSLVAKTDDETKSDGGDGTNADTEQTAGEEGVTRQAATEAATRQTASESATRQVTTEAATRQVATEATTRQTASATASTQASGGSITVSMENVNSSEAAAQAVEAAGLVDSWREFNTYLINNGYYRKISTGTFEFQGGEDFETIARTITKGR
jgi:hypothetical protein